MEKIKDSNLFCPAPISEEKEESKKQLEEKNYLLNLENEQHKLTISLNQEKSNNEGKIFNFKLFNVINKNEDNKTIYYENNKSPSELIKLFLINSSKYDNPIQSIFDKIEKFHINNNATIQKKNNTENIIELLYTLKTIDNEELLFKIELYKKEIINDNKKDDNILLKEIISLKNYVKNMEEKYEKIIKEQNNEIKLLKEKIENLMVGNNKRKKLINEEEQLIFKSDLLSLNNIKIINADIDGGRGVNDLFEVYNLYNEKKAVYLAVKSKGEKDISSIDIFKITSIDNIKRIKRLEGHKKRIVFIKYFINPYTKQEYLLSGDREEKIIAWEILDETNFKLLCKITTNYGRLMMQQSIYNCILYFTENKDYIYATTVTNNYSRLYELENGALLKNVIITYFHYTFYLIKYKDLIIDVCRNSIFIYNPFNEIIYAKIECEETKGDNRSACIIYNKNGTDYLNISNSNGYVIIYDLKKKNIISIINLKKDLYHIISWDLSSLIVAEYNTEYLEIINLDLKKKNVIKCTNNLICVKKIILNETNEILLTSTETNNNVYISFSTPSGDNNAKK